MVEEQKGKKSLYEVGYHLEPTIGEGDLDVAVDKVHEVIKGTGAVIVSEDRAKNFSPAYALTRSRGGKRESFDTSYVGFIKFESTPEAAHEISGGLKTLDFLLRSLVIGAYKEIPMSRPKSRSVFGRVPKDTKVSVAEEPADSVSKEAIDKEIEKLIVE